MLEAHLCDEAACPAPHALTPDQIGDIISTALLDGLALSSDA
jgi:hypothetical protein